MASNGKKTKIKRARRDLKLRVKRHRDLRRKTASKTAKAVSKTTTKTSSKKAGK